MPTELPGLSFSDVRRHIENTTFNSQAPDRLGVEVEWLCHLDSDPSAHLSATSFSELVQVVHELPLMSTVTFEPGGQLELSSLPLAPGPGVADDLVRDLREINKALADLGVALEGVGFDPVRSQRRLIETPRYAAMESYFHLAGTAGRRMMCSTAAVQVNLDVGSTREIEARWRRAHVIGPTLAAAFANSPFALGRPTGWKSTRLATWWAIDPSRTGAADVHSLPAEEAWLRYALDARVMLIRNGDDFVPIPSNLSFEEWMVRGHELGWPVLDDFEYHLTTLFPPVRPRGWFELRIFDALPHPWWLVAAAIATTLLYDEEAGAAAEEAAAPARSMWLDGFRYGLARPELALAARRCFEVALEAMPRVGFDDRTAILSNEYHERFVARAETPADELLDAWNEDGSLFKKEDYDLEAAWT